MNVRELEVLAPAGDWERLEAALTFGADAVYLGGGLCNMRASTKSFGLEELARAVEKAHALGKRVYFTCNTLPTNEDADLLPTYLPAVAETSVDALILSDIGTLMLAERLLPGMELHVSTQAGITNYLTARELYALGARRVILARECSLETIREIREKTPPDLAIECFVHGAMCMSFSGRCLLSQYLTGRDANAGACTQPCRWKYALMEEKRPGQYFPVEETAEGSYILNAKDLCLIEHIDKLAEAGVSSLKIEGRAKSAYYVAVTAGAYRRAVELWKEDPAGYTCPRELWEEVRKVSHREYSTGFLFGRPEPGQCYESGGYIRDYEVLGVVTGYDPETKRLLLLQRNKFSVGQELELLIPMAGVRMHTVTALYEEDGTPTASVPHAAAPFQMDYPEALPVGTLLRRQVTA